MFKYSKYEFQVAGIIAAGIFFFTLFTSLAYGQWPYHMSDPPRGAMLSATMSFIPNSTTSFTTKTTDVDMIVLSNTTAGAVTVTISDSTTNCNSTVCYFLKDVSIAANTTYIVMQGGGVRFTGGIKWSASAANSVTGVIRGVYRP